MTTEEHRRLGEDAAEPDALAALGAVRQRARLGHGPRGLQRRTATPGTSCRTTWPAARPIAGARTASPASATATSSSCFAPAFWNGRDPILKERLFGLTPDEGNHGEDVKEYYFYLDNTPTHSYMKFLYKYPQAEFPYGRLIEENRRRDGAGPEFELLDTGIFDEDRYFDIFIEYAKADAGGPRASGSRRSTAARSRRRCTSCRTCGSATPGPGTASRGREPRIALGPRRRRSLSAWWPTTRDVEPPARSARRLPARPAAPVRAGRRRAAVHRQRDERAARLRPRQRRAARRYVKDAFHRHVIDGEHVRQPRPDAAPRPRSTTASTPCPPGGSVVAAPAADRRSELATPLADVDAIVAQRRAEADEFYDAHPPAGGHRRRAAASSARRSPACSGPSRSTSSTSTVWLDGDNPDCAAAGVARRRSATSTGGT